MPEPYAAGRDHTGNKADYKAQGEYNRAYKRYSSDDPFDFRGEGRVRETDVRVSPPDKDERVFL